MPRVHAKHFKQLVATIQSSRLQHVRVRGIHGIEDSIRNEKSNAAHRAAQRTHNTEKHLHADDFERLVKAPPIQYVQVEARHISVSKTQKHASKFVAIHPKRHLQQMQNTVSPEQALQLSDNDVQVLQSTAAHRLLTTHPVIHAIRTKARAYLDGELNGSPRSRRLRVVTHTGHESTMVDTSPTVFVPMQGAEEEVDADLTRFDSNPDRVRYDGTHNREQKGLQHYLHCADKVRDGDTGKHVSARCLIHFMNEAQRHPELLDEVLALLEPDALMKLQQDHAHAPNALMTVAATIGTQQCQQVLATLLLSMDAKVPDLKSFADAQDFFFVVDAISEVRRPSSILFDAVIEAMDMHKYHGDQFYQLQLALGTMAARLPTDHPNQSRVKALLHSHFDEALAENQKVEQRYSHWLNTARAEFDNMGEDEQHMWMAHFHHIDRRSWGETWDYASADERYNFREETIETLAHVLAGTHPDGDGNGDDGYGLKHDYHETPFTRRAKAIPRTQEQVVEDDDAHDEFFSLFDLDEQEQRQEQEQGYSTLPDNEVPMYTEPTHLSHAANERALRDLLSVQAVDLRYAVQALANFGHSDSAPRVVALAQHRKLSIRAFAVNALHAFPTAQARRVLLDTMLNPVEDPALRVSAVDAMGEWPDSAIHPDMEDAALRHLATLEGIEWTQCTRECTSHCFHRDIRNCEQSCTKKCEAAAALEVSIVSFLNVRMKHSATDIDSPDQLESHALTLANVDTPEHYRVAGARRLYKSLASLERFFSKTKFDFVRLFVFVFRPTAK